MYITRKAKQYNEDGVLYKPPYYLVIDGATPLSKDKRSAHLLKTYIIRYFIKTYEVHKDITKTLQVLSKKYYDNHEYKHKKPVDLPSAGLAIVIEHQSQYELFLLGDTTIMVEYRNGEIEVFHDDRLTKLDHAAMQINDHQKRLKQIRHNRNQLGKLYNAFIPSNNLSFKDHTYRLDKNNVKKIRLCTDGFMSIFDTYNQYDSLSTFMASDIKTIKKEIENISFKDKEMTLYPRFKIIDDISVIEIMNDAR